MVKFLVAACFEVKAPIFRIRVGSMFGTRKNIEDRFLDRGKLPARLRVGEQRLFRALAPIIGAFAARGRLQIDYRGRDAVEYGDGSGPLFRIRLNNLRIFRRVLANPDLGCGEGYGTRLLSEVCERIVGFDVSRDVVRHAEAQYGRSECEFQWYDGVRLPVEDGQFDAVVSFHVIEHVENALQPRRQGRVILTEMQVGLVELAHRRIVAITIQMGIHVAHGRSKPTTVLIIKIVVIQQVVQFLQQFTQTLVAHRSPPRPLQQTT